MVFNDLQWPIKKTCQAIRYACMIYGRIKWKWTLLDLEKALDMANQDVLNEFDLTLEEGGGGNQRSYCDPE